MLPGPSSPEKPAHATIPLNSERDTTCHKAHPHPAASVRRASHGFFCGGNEHGATVSQRLAITLPRRYDRDRRACDGPAPARSDLAADSLNVLLRVRRDGVPLLVRGT